VSSGQTPDERHQADDGAEDLGVDDGPQGVGDPDAAQLVEQRVDDLSADEEPKTGPVVVTIPGGPARRGGGTPCLGATTSGSRAES
jgi:hypothetical protein